MIAVVDYGAGNTQSVVNALAAVLPADVEACLTADPAAILAADGIIVPGVGAARDTISNLERAGLVETLLDVIRLERPYLGICMGMQALMSFSEEHGGQRCLDVIPGGVRRFETDLPVPHMGWNTVEPAPAARGHPLLAGIPDSAFFYYVHSYVCVPDDPSWLIGTTDYAGPFAAILGKGNLLGTQFHPEKSGRHGLRLIANFVDIALRGGVSAESLAARSVD